MLLGWIFMPRRTEAQEQAWQRSNRIRLLRGLYGGASYLLDEAGKKQVLSTIDMNLISLGAQSESDRRKEDREAALEGKGHYVGFGKKRRFELYDDQRD